tara:strand:+ start:253 stop:663 length:411 start_codon:yes stop_codon:yes gene_type:complete
MAYNSKKIFPIDLQPRKALGVKLPLSGKAVFESTFQTKDAIRNNIINFFLTGIGERYMNPTFGTPIRNLLFENITNDNIDNIKDAVRRGLGEYFPLVIANEFQVTGDPDRNTVSLLLRYSIKDTSLEDEVVINFEQ